jgi:hypothetical protein
MAQPTTFECNNCHMVKPATYFAYDMVEPDSPTDRRGLYTRHQMCRKCEGVIRRRTPYIPNGNPRGRPPKPVDPNPSEKTCFHCKETKPIEEFGSDASRKDGLTMRCKTCTVSYSKEYKKKIPGLAMYYRQNWEMNKDALARGVAAQAWTEEDAEKMFPSRARIRAKVEQARAESRQIRAGGDAPVTIVSGEQTRIAWMKSRAKAEYERAIDSTLPTGFVDSTLPTGFVDSTLPTRLVGAFNNMEVVYTKGTALEQQSRVDVRRQISKEQKSTLELFGRERD